MRSLAHGLGLPSSQVASLRWAGRLHDLGKIAVDAAVLRKPGKLDDVALATRLSLFLWNSTPDATLRNLASKGDLGKPDVLRAQSRRLLDDPKSRRFVEAFTDYWLDLRKVDETSPSSTIALAPSEWSETTAQLPGTRASTRFTATTPRGSRQTASPPRRGTAPWPWRS